MKYTPTIIAALLLAAHPAFAGTEPSAKAPMTPAPVAEEPTFSYNFVEAGWKHLDFDGLGDTDGYYVHASYSPVKPFFLHAGSGQDFGDTLDRDSVRLGAGVYIPLIPRIHWVTTAGAEWQDVDFDGPGPDNDEWAFQASTGLRIRMCPKSELEVAYIYTADGGDNQHAAGVGILYNLTPQLQLTVRGYFSNDENGFGAGIRYNF